MAYTSFYSESDLVVLGRGKLDYVGGVSCAFYLSAVWQQSQSARRYRVETTNLNFDKITAYTHLPLLRQGDITSHYSSSIRLAICLGRVARVVCSLLAGAI